MKRSTLLASGLIGCTILLGSSAFADDAAPQDTGSQQGPTDQQQGPPPQGDQQQGPGIQNGSGSTQGQRQGRPHRQRGQDGQQQGQWGGQDGSGSTQDQGRPSRYQRGWSGSGSMQGPGGMQRGGPRGPEMFFSTGGQVTKFFSSDLSDSDLAAANVIVQTAHDGLIQAHQTEKSARDAIMQASSGSIVDTGALAAAHTVFVASATDLINTAVTDLAPYIDSTKTDAFTARMKEMVTNLSKMPPQDKQGMQGAWGKGPRLTGPYNPNEQTSSDQANTPSQDQSTPPTQDQSNPPAQDQASTPPAQDQTGVQSAQSAPPLSQYSGLVMQFKTKLASVPDASKQTVYTNVINRITTLESTITDPTIQALLKELATITQNQLDAYNTANSSGVSIDSIFGQ